MRQKPTLAVITTVLLGSLPVSALRAQVEDYREIVYPPLQEFQIPRPELFDLDNGLRVFLLEDHELPLIDVTARIRTGSVYESEDKTGLAGIVGAVQRTGGTRSMSGDEIDDFLEARAAQIETSISNTAGFASMNCLASDFDDVFGVFVEILGHPSFAEDKIEIAQVQANAGVARRNDNVLGITSREFNRLVYGPESPLSRLEEYATIAAITRNDLVAWHAKYYHPNSMLIGVVGDFDSKAMKKKIRAAFSDWPRGPDFDEPSLEYRKDQTAGIYFIEKGDVTQANIRLGHLGITYDNPDYFAVQVLNEVLSGGFAGRLFSRIRSDKGLAYSVGGQVGASFRYPGVAGFGLQTKSETMAEAVDALYHEVQGMITEPATDEELAKAKDSILNSFIFNYASRSQVLGQQMLYSYYGLPLDFLEKYRSNIETVTAEDVARVAEKYLHPDQATLLVVGRSADFDRPVSSYGEVTELDISIPPPPSTLPEVARTAESLAAGGAILADVVTSLGGDHPEKTDAIRTKSSMVISRGGQSLAIDQTRLVVFPDKLHTVLDMPMGQQIMVVSGSEGFVSMAGQTRELSGDEAEKRVRDLGRAIDYVVRFHAAEELEAVAAGQEVVRGTECRVVVVRVNDIESRIWVAADGTVVKQVYQAEHPFTAAPVHFEVFFSDYREIEGRWVAFRREIWLEGAEFATLTIESYEINPEIDPAIFERPAA